jgi:hypothetical protein
MIAVITFRSLYFYATSNLQMEAAGSTETLEIFLTNSRESLPKVYIATTSLRLLLVNRLYTLNNSLFTNSLTKALTVRHLRDPL